MTATLSKPIRWLVVIAALGIVLAGIIWYVRSKRPKPSPAPKHLAQFVTLKNIALGQLENIPNQQEDDGEQCAKSFADLAKEIPGELLGARNLAIARLLSLEKLDRKKEPQAAQQLGQQCQSAIEQLTQLEPENGIPNILAAKLAIALGDTDTAIKQFQAAGKKMPNDFVPWSELFLLVRDGDDLKLRQESLELAFASNPDNLVLVENLIGAQAQSKDSSLIKTLKTAKRILSPLAEGMVRYQIHIDQELDAFSERIKSGDEKAWNQVRIRMIQVFNVVRAELAYHADVNQLSRHPLEYAIHDFSDAFYESLPPTDDTDTNDNPVKLSVASDRPLPAITDATDIVLCDFNLDDKLDIVVLRQAAVEIYSATGEDPSWKQIARCKVPADMDRLLVVDFDRDTQTNNAAGFRISDEDLLVYGKGGYQFLENKQVEDPAQRQLIKRDSPLKLDVSTEIQTVVACDIDHDGDLDLLAAIGTKISIWLNQEKWRFAESEIGTGLARDASSIPTSLTAVDWNRNVLADILVGHDNGPTELLQNIRHGRFRGRTLGKNLGPSTGVHQILACEIDGNASWDLLACHDQGISLSLTATGPDASVWATHNLQISDTPTQGIHTWDFDNDGMRDIVAWGQQGIEIFRGTGSGKFAKPFSPAGIEPGPVGACAVGDLDHDGDQDLALVVNQQPIWFLNDGGNKNHWIDVRLCAEADPKLPIQRTNLFGVGSLVELKVGQTYQAQQVAGQVTHFGLGNQEKADAIRILWTNGIPQNIVSPDTKLTLTEKQRLLKGSCPYLYTWTGSKYEFFTDLLWAAPIGLQTAEGVLAPTRNWEYLLIEGEKLRPYQGEYRLQVTEELWEAAYFDQIELIAVDHPQETSVFSNEKVGPPAVSQFQIHAMADRQLVPPVAAIDSNDNDVLPLIHRRDGRYVKLFDHRLKQGLTNKYFLELDLGSLDDPSDIKLVMTGWVFPTDTSINVAISQNPAIEPPDPPSIWVPDPAASTGWKLVVPHMGFPGGKTKSIVVTVPADQFVDGDFRVRISSSMELYWDEILMAVDASPVQFQKTPIKLIAADLHYRGFSARHAGRHHGPDVYDYQRVLTEPAWPPMAGNFTRFGDVTDLLQSNDHRLVVLGAGDEMTLRFAQLPPPEAGFKRDFLLHNVGWDKDADLNTVHGHHVEPLPFTGMAGYPPGPNDTPPDTEEFQDYLRTYQTRQYSRQQFWGRLQAQ